DWELLQACLSTIVACGSFAVFVAYGAEAPLTPGDCALRIGAGVGDSELRAQARAICRMKIESEANAANAMVAVDAFITHLRKALGESGLRVMLSSTEGRRRTARLVYEWSRL